MTTKLVALIPCRLTATNPAPAELRAIAFQGTTAIQLKTAYKAGLKALKAEMKQYKSFKRLALLEDKSDSIVVDGVLIANLLDTENLETK